MERLDEMAPALLNLHQLGVQVDAKVPPASSPRASRSSRLSRSADRIAIGALDAALVLARETGEDRPALEVLAGSLAEMGVRAVCTTRSARLLTRDRDAWLLRLRSAERSASSIRAYRHAINDLLGAATRAVPRSCSRSGTIVAYLDDYRRRRNPAEATYYRRFTLLRRFFRWLSRRSGVPDPFLDLQPPGKPQQEAAWLTKTSSPECSTRRGAPRAATRTRRTRPARPAHAAMTACAAPSCSRSTGVTSISTASSPRCSCAAARAASRAASRSRPQPPTSSAACALAAALSRDPVFCGLAGTAHLHDPRHVIRRAAERAGIDKSVSAHTLRPPRRPGCVSRPEMRVWWPLTSATPTSRPLAATHTSPARRCTAQCKPSPIA